MSARPASSFNRRTAVAICAAPLAPAAAFFGLAISSGPAMAAATAAALMAGGCAAVYHAVQRIEQRLATA